MSEQSGSSSLILSFFSLKNVANLFARSGAELKTGKFVILCRKRRSSIILKIALDIIRLKCRILNLKCYRGD